MTEVRIIKATIRWILWRLAIAITPIVIWVDHPLFKSSRKPTRLRLLWIIDNASLLKRYVLCDQLERSTTRALRRLDFLRITRLVYLPPRLRQRTHSKLTNSFLQRRLQPLEKSLGATELPLRHRPPQILYQHFKMRLHRHLNHKKRGSLICIIACR